MRRVFIGLLVFSLLFFAIPTFVEAQTPSSTPTQMPAAGQAATQTPAAVSSAAAAAAATCSNPYTIQSGDTMTAIAQKCGVAYSALLAANTNFSNPNLIFPGQTLNIPTGIPNTGGNTYTVVAGDTLFSIASRFNTTVQAILNANSFITNQNLILPGWVIALPAGSGTGIPNTGGQTYTVVAGDTLSGIAQRFNTTTTALLNANPSITNPNLIFAGNVIKIP